MKSKLRTQKRIPGLHRKPVGSAVTKQIEQWLKEQMRHFGVSRSFVIATALAHTAKIPIEDDYRKPQLVRKRA